MACRKLVMVLFAGLLLAATMGCEREGPAERAGEKVDRTVEEAGERTRRATE